MGRRSTYTIFPGFRNSKKPFYSFFGGAGAPLFFQGEKEVISNATSQKNITVLFSTFTLLGSLKESFKQEEEEEEKGRSVGVIVPSSLLSSLLFLPLLWETEGGGGRDRKTRWDLFFLPSTNRGIPRESRPVIGVALGLWFSALCSEYTCGFPRCGKENIALVRIKTRPTRKKVSIFVLVSFDIPLLPSCFPSYGKL